LADKRSICLEFEEFVLYQPELVLMLQVPRKAERKSTCIYQPL